MKVILFLTLVCYAASNPVEEYSRLPEEITIETKSQGLPFPLPDSNDLVSVMVHGLHCSAMLAEGDNSTEFSRMHLAHCGRLVKPIWNYVKETKFSVPHDLCDAMLGVDPAILALKARLGSYNYYDDNWLQQLNTSGTIPKPAENMIKLAGYNYGKMLWMEYKHPERLSQTEQDYLDSWFAPLKIRQAAIAFACTEYDDISIKLKKADISAGEYEVQVTQ